MMDGLTPAGQRSPTVVRTVRGSSPPDCSTSGSQTDTPPTSVGGPLREGDGSGEERGGGVHVCVGRLQRHLLSECELNGIANQTTNSSTNFKSHFIKNVQIVFRNMTTNIFIIKGEITCRSTIINIVHKITI